MTETTDPQAEPRERCGDQLDPPHAPPTECVLPPGHQGSHADELGCRWRVCTPPADRAALAERLWPVAEHNVIAEWICCEPLAPGHTLCAQGYKTLEMLKALLVDDPDASKPAPLLDAALAAVPSVAADRGALCRELADEAAEWGGVITEQELRRKARQATADEATAEHHTVDGVRHLCHTGDHYCPDADGPSRMADEAQQPEVECAHDADRHGPESGCIECRCTSTDGHEARQADTAGEQQ